MTDTLISGSSYIYGIHVNDNAGNFGQEPARIKVDTTPSVVSCSSGVDIGLRIYQNGVRKVAVEVGVPSSYLRIYQDGIHGVILVDPSDPNASNMLIQTPGGAKALCLLP